MRQPGSHIWTCLDARQVREAAWQTHRPARMPGRSMRLPGARTEAGAPGRDGLRCDLCSSCTHPWAVMKGCLSWGMPWRPPGNWRPGMPWIISCWPGIEGMSWPGMPLGGIWGPH